MATATSGLNTHIWNNNLRSIILLASYPVLLLGIFWMIAAVIGLSITPQPGTLHGDPVNFAAGTAFANNILAAYWPSVIAVVAIWFLIAWFFNAAMIRKMSHAHGVTRKEEPELYNLLENLCIAQGVPMPSLQIIESHARNAFASGIDQKSYAITVTRGLLNALSRDEVEAVLAHELTHIMNRDVRLLVVSIIFTGMLGFAAQMAWSSFRYNVWAAPRRNRNRQGGGAIMLVILAVIVILWIGYFATLFTRFALSRRREFMADAGAIQMTKNPEAMMRALMRIAQRDRIPEVTADIALMCTQNSHSFMGLFATHPPIENRIRAISETTKTPVPDAQARRSAGQDERFSAGSNSLPNPWLTRTRPVRGRNPWTGES